MTWVELTEIIRNVVLVLLAAGGAGIAYRQWRRAEARDDLDLYIKALDFVADHDAVRRRSGFALMRRLAARPATAELALEALSDYVGDTQNGRKDG